MILLSIIIPVFNRQDLLDRLLCDLSTAIKDHKLSDSIEVIIVDDFSLPPIDIPSYQYNYILVRNKTNLGAPLSRETGYKLCQGKFIHFHDSDDSFERSWLSQLIETLKETPDLDIILTGRDDISKHDSNFRFQKYFHKRYKRIPRINKRIVYRNCLGPLGGVTFSKRVIDKIAFKKFASCQDWQMYIDALKYAEVLVSRPDIKFIFNKTGDDRISHNPHKKILGHLQLAKITGKKSPFGRSLRLFYLYTCKQHIFNKGGNILKLYQRKRVAIFATFILVSIYWRIT